MDTSLVKSREVFVFIDDVLIVTKGTKEEHLDKVRELLESTRWRQTEGKGGKMQICRDENLVPWFQIDKPKNFARKIQKCKASRKICGQQV